MESKTIPKVNKTYWNANADKWFGTTAMPKYRVQFVAENELHKKSVNVGDTADDLEGANYYAIVRYYALGGDSVGEKI